MLTRPMPALLAVWLLLFLLGTTLGALGVRSGLVQEIL
jgi:hypothetical protein